MRLFLSTVLHAHPSSAVRGLSPLTNAAGYALRYGSRITCDVGTSLGLYKKHFNGPLGGGEVHDVGM